LVELGRLHDEWWLQMNRFDVVKSEPAGYDPWMSQDPAAYAFDAGRSIAITVAVRAKDAADRAARERYTPGQAWRDSLRLDVANLVRQKPTPATALRQEGDARIVAVKLKKPTGHGYTRCIGLDGVACTRGAGRGYELCSRCRGFKRRGGQIPCEAGCGRILRRFGIGGVCGPCVALAKRNTRVQCAVDGCCAMLRVGRTKGVCERCRRGGAKGATMTAEIVPRGTN
jgi:hypothetical protein